MHNVPKKPSQYGKSGHDCCRRLESSNNDHSLYVIVYHKPFAASLFNMLTMANAEHAVPYEVMHVTGAFSAARGEPL